MTNLTRRWATVVAIALAATGLTLGAASAAEPDLPAGCPIYPDADPAVIKELYKIGLEREISAKVMLAMFEAGWVESHMHNLPCGHLDSVGVFQQRPSQGWCDPASLCQDVGHATDKFLDRAEQREPGCGAECTAGELADMVQNSGFPDRYDEEEAKARELIEEAKALQEPGLVTVGTAGGSGVKHKEIFWSFFQRADNRAQRYTYVANVGWDDHNMAGSVTSAPSTVVFRDDLWVFARDGDGRLSYRVRDGAAWTDWMWKAGAISGAPATGTLGERMFVVARTGDELKYRYHDLDTGWNSSDTWLGLGRPGATTRVVSDPVIGAIGDKLLIVARGSDGHTWIRWATAGPVPRWSAWDRLTAAISGTPAVASTRTELHVFARTPAGAMIYHTYTEGVGWTHNRGLGSAPSGTFAGSPAAISFGGLLTVYSRNDAGQLLYRDLRGSHWAAWLQLGRPGEINLDSSPVAMRNSGTRYVAARGTDQVLYSRAYRTDTGWAGWTRHPANLAPMR